MELGKNPLDPGVFFVGVLKNIHNICGTMKDFCVFTPTHIYTLFCYACFEKTNLFQYTHSMGERLEPNMNFLLLVHRFRP